MEIKNKELIKIALIGCGRISKNHIKSILLYPELCQLSVICDCDLKRIEAAKELSVKIISQSDWPKMSE